MSYFTLSNITMCLYYIALFSTILFIIKTVVFMFTGGDKTAKCIHGGGTFVIPLIQDYGVLSLEPMTTDIDLKGALSKGNIRVAVPSTFTFGISTHEIL